MGLAVFYETPDLRLWFQSLPWPLGVWVDHGSDIQRYGCLAIEIVVIQSFFVSYSDVQKNQQNKTNCSAQFVYIWESWQKHPDLIP